MKKTLLTALLLSGVSLFAGKPSTIKVDKGNEFLKENNQLTFRKPATQRNFLKLNNTFLSNSGKEWDEAGVTGSGLFINFGLFFPPTSYLNYDYQDGDITFKTGYNLEFGSYFRFAKLADGQFGLGLRVTWLSLGYTKVTDDKDIYRAAEISLLRVGPQFGIALNEKMGLDFFYQFGFNLTDAFADVYTGASTKGIGISSAYYGITHELGAAFHYQIYSIGFGYRFGKVKNFLNVVDGKQLDNAFLDDTKSAVNSLRITLGVKF